MIFTTAVVLAKASPAKFAPWRKSIRNWGGIQISVKDTSDPVDRTVKAMTPCRTDDETRSGGACLFFNSVKKC